MSSWWLIASASKAELEPQGETPKLTLYGWTLLSLKLIDKVCLQHWNETKRVTENTILMFNSVSQDDLVQLCFCNEVTALIHTHRHNLSKEERTKVSVTGRHPEYALKSTLDVSCSCFYLPTCYDVLIVSPKQTHFPERTTI